METPDLALAWLCQPWQTSSTSSGSAVAAISRQNPSIGLSVVVRAGWTLPGGVCRWGEGLTLRLPHRGIGCQRWGETPKCPLLWGAREWEGVAWTAGAAVLVMLGSRGVGVELGSMECAGGVGSQGRLEGVGCWGGVCCDQGRISAFELLGSGAAISILTGNGWSDVTA